MTDPVLRTATAEDRVAMTAIYNDAVVHSVATFDLEARDEDHYVPHLTSTRPGDHVVVAEAGGRVVGFAHSGTYRPRPAYDGTREVSIYLDEGSRGTGLGRRLYEELLRRVVLQHEPARARAQGLVDVLVEVERGQDQHARVLVGREDPARRLEPGELRHADVD